MQAGPDGYRDVWEAMDFVHAQMRTIKPNLDDPPGRCTQIDSGYANRTHSQLPLMHTQYRVRVHKRSYRNRTIQEHTVVLSAAMGNATNTYSRYLKTSYYLLSFTFEWTISRSICHVKLVQKRTAVLRNVQSKSMVTAPILTLQC